MTKKKVFLIAQSALCVLIAVFLAAAAVSIFTEGSAFREAGHPSEWIYTREKVGARLVPVIPLIVISLCATVYGLTRGIKDENADKPVQDTELTRDLMCARVSEPSEEMSGERDLQRKYRSGGLIGFAVCMIPVLLYIINPGHFELTDAKGLDRSIIALVSAIFPWTAAGLACLVISTVQQSRSMQRETEAATARMKEEKAAGITAAPQTSEPDPKKSLRLILLRRALMLLAVCFIVMGIFNGGMKDVLVKAIKICTECIGLG